jgi:hypothetical protein
LVDVSVRTVFALLSNQCAAMCSLSCNRWRLLMHAHWLVGAGLVWHTDAAAWQAGEDSDPDVVDWDIDTRIHYRYIAMLGPVLAFGSCQSLSKVHLCCC